MEIDKLISVSFEEHENYLEIKYSGYKDIYEFYFSLEQAFKICDEKNYNYLIFDVNNVDFKKIKDMDRYDAGMKIGELFGGNNLKKIAIVRPVGYSDNLKKLAPLIAANRGAMIEIFENKIDAIEWFNND